MSWNTLSERQKQLDRAIDDTGVKLDTSERCLRQVMRAIGASPSEELFIRERIALRLRTEVLLGKTDKFYADLAEICKRNNGIWSDEAEKYVLANAKKI